MSKEIAEKLELAITAAKEGNYPKINLELADAEVLLASLSGEEAKPEEKVIEELAPEAILEELQNRRQKGAKGSPAFGKTLPQVEIAAEDIEKALADVDGVTTDYLEQYGFLTHIYRNAAARTEADITKFNDGLLIKFE